MLPSVPTAAEQWAARHPGLDTSPMEIVALLKRVMALRDRAVEPLYEGAPLTLPEVDLLVPLRHLDQPVTASRIADLRKLSRAAISKALTKLEKRGLIARTANPADRRASLVALTEEGKAAVDALFPHQLAIEARLLAGLGEGRGQVLDALNLLADTMERGLAGPASADGGED
ncbi:MarR family transcriptional regulator [Streptomyces sp. CB03238]|uniref:MarR family winged helix-turn-helix transcriptional regulator n=1 Tax=Streptomyces sp. CB03238 TaxID=1907777 RepID=UPI001F4DAEAD|nr:MarR family transcriptional regulator [Streptomyces sp. CB03238]